MVSKKVFFSILLLFAYSLGMAHNVIPHCHHPLQIAELAHDHMLKHEHHHQGVSDFEDHNHIGHDDHLDESLYDFIVCLLSEGDRPVSEDYCSLNLPVSNEANSNKTFQSKFVTSCFPIYTEAAMEIQICGINTNFFIDCHSIEPSAFSYRGPPSLS